VEAQNQYARRAMEAYASEMSKLGEMYLSSARNVAKPVAQYTILTTLLRKGPYGCPNP
jgi:hypothetical protein